MVAEDYETILEGKYPSKLHTQRVIQEIQRQIPVVQGIIYLEGGITRLLEDSDLCEPFRQRRYFYYLTGCELSDCHLLYDIQCSKSILFIPPTNPEEIAWSGHRMNIDEALHKYDVDEVRLSTELDQTISDLSRTYSSGTMFSIAHQESEMPRLVEFKHHDCTTLKNAINSCRIIKDDFEIAMLRKANHISSLAHEVVMERVSTATNEMELEAIFAYHCAGNGAKKMAYPMIAAGGRAAATLHYVTNNASLQGKLNVLLDAGAEWNNYAADITRTFPLNGTFSQASQEIYSIVLQMQTACIAMIRESVNWDDVHLLAHEIAIEGLLKLGILRGHKHDILAAKTSLAFFPHGLGHYIGLETHDVGGCPNSADPNPLLRPLRKRGPLPAGSVITVEPGLYFCEAIIAPYLDDSEQSRFIDVDVLRQYWEVGGVRIEDSVLVTKTACENLTTAKKETWLRGGGGAGPVKTDIE